MSIEKGKSLSVEEKKKNVIDDYDDIAKEYAEEFFCDSSDNKYIDAFLNSLEGIKVLDVGCGNGRDCKYISQKGFDINGIDLSVGMLEIAKEKVPNGKFEIMDITNITYPDNSYDGIISNCSLFHIPVEELPKTLDSFRRILKPNGKLLLILQEGNGETMVEEPYRPGVHIYMNYFSVSQIQNLLQEYGFNIDYLGKEESPNEFELGSGKLIVLSNNKKKLKLIQSENGEDFYLCNEMGVRIVHFWVEINKETALISYETQESFRNQGYASKGLILLRDTLFSNGSILFLELIHLSGDYSRKVAENAGFFSRSNNLEYYFCLNPHAEQIINDRLSSLDTFSVEYKRTLKLFEKVQNNRLYEKRAKQKLQDKLNELLQRRELEEPGEYRERIETEIDHIQKILPNSYDIKKL